MASLTETAYYTRRIIKFGAIGVLVFIILKGAASAGFRYWRQRHPEPPPAPTVSFGKLPAIQFPQSKFNSADLTYRLETVAGGLPNLGDQIKVYFIPLQSPGLLNLERANNLAKRMGFFSEPEKISDRLHRWQKQKILNSVLTIDIIHGSFKIEKNWRDYQELFQEKMLPAKGQAMAEARDFLSQYSLLSTDLEIGEAQVDYLRFISPNLVPAVSLSEADLVQIYLFRPSLDSLPLLPPDPKQALVSLLISGSRDQEKRILEVNYAYFPIIRETTATYPLKNTAQAWEELKSGQAFIAVSSGSAKEITIRKAYLAYFENSLPQNYLQPIYVFEGSDDFVAYVSAISPEWTE